MRLDRLVFVLGVLVLAAPARAQAQEPDQKSQTAALTLADGSTVHLHDFHFVVELASWAKGDSPSAATIERVSAKVLWTGKRALPLAGASLELVRTTTERAGETEADGRPVLVSRLKEAALVAADGRRTVVKLEAPDPTWLQKDKSRLVRARAIDIEGESLLGGRTSYCVVSFTPLVECPGRPEFLVNRISLTP